MERDPVTVASAILVALLVVGSALARLVDGATPPSRLAGGALCVGVRHPSLPRIGLVEGDRGADLLPRAVARLALPDSCASEAAPPVRSGDLLELEARDGRCAVTAVRRLPGELRLLCGARFDPNRDSAADLAAIPGLGPARARALVEERADGGPFTGPADLERVRGIGAATAAKLAPWMEWPDKEVHQ